jgi:Domain of unknown function (DUF5122) beta-propeller
MRRRPAAALTTIIITLLAVAAAAAIAAPAAPVAARLDRTFGVHHGYWLRGGAAWGTAARVVPGQGGTALVIGEDGRAGRIGTNGRPDRGWGRRGVLDVASRSGPWSLRGVRWGRRFAFTVGTGQPRLVVDARGRRLEATDELAAAVPPVPGAGVSDWMAPGPDGSLWLLRTATGQRGSLIRVAPDGRPRGVRMPLPFGDVLGDGFALTPVATRDGIVVVPSSNATGRLTVRRLRPDGALDPRFRPVALGASVAAVLPWRRGVVVVADTRVLWIDGAGRVVRRSPLPHGINAAFDAAGRLLVVSATTDGTGAAVRRLRADGTRDRAFGLARLEVPGVVAAPLGVVAVPGGRVIVVGQTIEEPEPDFREDVGAYTTGTVVWRLRTR